MAKKSSKKTLQLPSYITAGTLAIVLTFFIVTSAVYLMEKSYLNATEEQYENEMKIMENQIADMKGKVVKSEIKTVAAEEKHAPGEAEGKTAEEKVVVSTEPDVEYRFEKCGFLSSFIYEDWYPELKTNLDKLQIKPKDVSSACYSEKGSMIVFIAQTGKECEGPKVYKFNTDTNTFGLAKVLNKSASCLSPVDVFGMRNKYVINATGERALKGCSYKDYFEYNYSKNTVELTKISYKCEGDTEWKSTVY